MQADLAMNEENLRTPVPAQPLTGQANVLIFPNLSAGNIAYKLLRELGGATAIGPILVGMGSPCTCWKQGATCRDREHGGGRRRRRAVTQIAGAAAPLAVIDLEPQDHIMSAPTKPKAAPVRRSLVTASTAGARAQGHGPLESRDGRAHRRPPCRRDEGQLADMGPFVAITTPHTGRSPNDKFVVKESGSGEGRRLGQGEPADERGALRGAARPT